MCNISSPGSAALTDCTFSANTAQSGDGGGMYNSFCIQALTNCTFSGNTAASGGGMYSLGSSPTLTNCTFTQNRAPQYGGGMFNASSSPNLTNCAFLGNSAGSGGFGGGIFNENESANSPATIANCIFVGNIAASGGGVCNWVSSPVIVNCTFIGNAADSSGGGMYSQTSSSATLSNCIVWGNIAASFPQVSQSSDSSTAITYSDIQDGYPGDGNIDADPQFIRNPSPGPDSTWGTADDDYGDLRLQLTSACIDAGDNSAVPAGITTDLGGYARFVDIPSVPDTGSGAAPIVDMGAYEAHVALYVDDSATGLNNGGSWKDAFTSLQPALAIAQPGDQLWVAAGTYTPTTATDRTVSFVLKSGVAIYGGFPDGGGSLAQRDWNANATILSGDIGLAGDNSDNSYHVVVGSGTDATAILDGFTIMGGNANNWSGPGQFVGGGMYNVSASPTVANCIFIADLANASGGGVYNQGSSPTFTGCTFTQNWAQYGGGMFNSSSSPSVTDCTFDSNSVSAHGGGMYNASSSPRITNTTFVSKHRLKRGWDGERVFLAGHHELRFSRELRRLGRRHLQPV